MIDFLYDRNRLFIFDIEENIENYMGFSNYRFNDTTEILSDYFHDLEKQLFIPPDGVVYSRFESYMINFNNISKVHIYLYPVTVFGEYHLKWDAEDKIKDFKDKAYQCRNFLPEMIKKNYMYIIDKFNIKMVSKMKFYGRKRIRLIYHLNNQNFFDQDKKKGDSIYVYDIVRPDPIIRKM